uniref:Uncharacterized protein n=1 Tax=Globodera rostochiensis TaxID=31243 RepID=A0A914HHG3_GLORO
MGENLALNTPHTNGLHQKRAMNEQKIINSVRRVPYSVTLYWSKAAQRVLDLHHTEVPSHNRELYEYTHQTMGAVAETPRDDLPEDEVECITEI